MAEWTNLNDENTLTQLDKRTNTHCTISRHDIRNDETSDENESKLIDRDNTVYNISDGSQQISRVMGNWGECEKMIINSNFVQRDTNGQFRDDSEPQNRFQSYDNGKCNIWQEEEKERLVDDNLEQMEESDSKICQEARQELRQVPHILQNSPKRPSSLYKEDVSNSLKLKNVFNEKNTMFDSATRILSPNNHVAIEKSIENLVNGKILKEDKQQHHVQFNKEFRNQQLCHTSEEKTHPSPSISTSTTSSSSEDNCSLEQFCEARPPDGGWGWIIVAASFMVNLIADGITFSFGVIYVEFLNYFGEGKSKTAWIGSLFMAMPLLSGPVASFLTDRYGCRKVSIAGSILATTGFVISSYANSMEVLIFTFGIVAGFGLSLCFVAAVVIVAYYFDKKRSFATGLSVCGSGIGTFIFAPVTQYLLAEYGWRGTTLILAGLFLNLAVCGCLMRDLEWTTTRARAKTEERKKNRGKMKSRIQSSSADSFSASSSVNTTTQTPHDPKRNFASANAMIIESLRLQDGDGGENTGKLFSSLVSLPTFVKNGEKVPLEVLELLSTRKNVYNVLLQNYPSLLISSRSFSDSSALHDQLSTPSARFISTPSPLTELKDKDDKGKDSCKNNDERVLRSEEQQQSEPAYLWWVKKIDMESPLRRASTLEQSRRLPTAYLKDIRMHRHSLTYRGAMLNINRYRLRASSCPDIYRNSMTTIAKTKLVWYAGLWEFWDLIIDILDFSYFADSRFLLFAISNFLLHTWYDVPYVYLTDNAIEVGFSETDASILISVIGITNMGGEVSDQN